MMRKEHLPFRFKEFSIKHDRSSMKVGTDGVLLGAWTDISNVRNVLDIGTGTGIIALMLAQRIPSAVLIHAVEIDEDAYEDAVENIKASPWSDRLKGYNTAIQNFYPEEKYDLIISNPPYFQNSFKPPDLKRVISRHTNTLNFRDLLDATERLLTPSGKLSIIFPYAEGLEFISMAEERNFYTTRKCKFRTRMGKPIERLLLELSPVKQESQTMEMVLYSDHVTWSDAYTQLTKVFVPRLPIQ